jgi:hypothetical protein
MSFIKRIDTDAQDLQDKFGTMQALILSMCLDV